MKILAYTAVTNGKDKPREDIVCFTDFKGDRVFSSAVYSAKIYKILPHKFLDTDISIWMDGNLFLKVPVEQVVKEWLGENDIAFFRHYKSKNLEWEKKWILYKFGRHSEVAKEAVRQVEHYAPLNIQKEELGMGGFIIRRHTPLVACFNEAWFAEICRWSQRDQLSLPVALRRFPDLKVHRIDGDIKKHPYLRYEDHRHFDT